MPRSTKSKRKKPTKKGRPSVFNVERDPPLVRKMLGLGKTMAEVSAALQVSRSTLDEWSNKHPEISDAISQGRADADDRVERALFDRAVGYEHPETKLLVTSGGHGVGSSVERHEVTVAVAPDPTCIKFWLTNRRRHLWSDKQKLEHSGTLTLEQMLTESWKKPDEKTEVEVPKGDA